MPQVVNAAETRKTYFGEKAATYDEGRETQDKWRREHDAVAGFLDGARGTVLDIPVGTGRFLPLYRELGLSCIGMDVSHEMMRQAVAKDASAEIRYGDILEIPLPDYSVDVTVCIRLLSLIDTPDMIAAMREMARVTKSRIIASVKLANERQVDRRSIWHPERDFCRVANETGWRIMDSRLARAPAYKVYLLTR